MGNVTSGVAENSGSVANGTTNQQQPMVETSRAPAQPPAPQQQQQAPAPSQGGSRAQSQAPTPLQPTPLQKAQDEAKKAKDELRAAQAAQQPKLAKGVPASQDAQVIKGVGGLGADTLTAREKTALKYDRVPVPMPGPDEVLINIKYSGVCHCDLHAMKGDLGKPSKTPFIGGHEGAGVVVGLGPGVTALKLGDHAGLTSTFSTCLQPTCAACRAGATPQCPARRRTGLDADGTFQQYVVARAAHVVRLPREVDLAAVVPVLCAGATAYRALATSGLGAGQDLVVVGAGGGVGHLVVQYARVMGLRVVAVDYGDEKRRVCVEKGGAVKYVDLARVPPPAAAARAAQGNQGQVNGTAKPAAAAAAAATADLRLSSLAREVRAASADGHGFHGVIVAASGAEAYTAAWAFARPGGTVVAVGSGTPGAVVQAPADAVVGGRLTLAGVGAGPSRQDVAEAVDVFRQALGSIKVQAKTVGLSELGHALELLERGRIAGRYVVDTSR